MWYLFVTPVHRRKFDITPPLLTWIYTTAIFYNTSVALRHINWIFFNMKKCSSLALLYTPRYLTSWAQENQDKCLLTSTRLSLHLHHCLSMHFYPPEFKQPDTFRCNALSLPGNWVIKPHPHSFQGSFCWPAGEDPRCIWKCKVTSMHNKAKQHHHHHHHASRDTSWK